MFGTVAAYSQNLTEAERERYRGCYCGLCRMLGQQYGFLGKMTLSYDMTFLTLLLSSLYEAPEESGMERCVAHPRKRHGWWTTKYTRYAADLSVALAYHHFLDDWKDDHKRSAWVGSLLLHRSYQRIKRQYPRQCAAIEDGLKQLEQLEASGKRSADAAAACFGYLMGELFCDQKDDHWAPVLMAVGDTLGRFIYVMDACLDLEEDRARGRYNPLLGTDSEQDANWQLELLTMLIGDCTAEFERLPLVQDVGILRNILHSGVWQRYKIQKEKKGAVHHDGGSL